MRSMIININKTALDTLYFVDVNSGYNEIGVRKLTHVLSNTSFGMAAMCTFIYITSFKVIKCYASTYMYTV